MIFLVGNMFALVEKIIFTGKLIRFHYMEFCFHYREKRLFISKYLLVLIGNVLLILRKIILQVKFCLFTSRKNIFTGNLMCVFQWRNMLSAQEKQCYSKIKMFLLVRNIFSLLGKIVLQVKFASEIFAGIKLFPMLEKIQENLCASSSAKYVCIFEKIINVFPQIRIFLPLL